ncbi:Lin1244/Lin1753 domain-containing protein [Alkalibacterium sp. 20]|uniref:Lin1244/Lin1753 domain-containing protein n=1 Tax=Alkalibacterium sp. 20 TaxID=1798803 RepID=UPI0008FFF4B2|nr:Lin1244/Lin1753 domain-containing protein [Alkalibacterium sp. 20]OJF92815.1 hypothetical protein AX762_09530 [Alkalibacterium sp. 20]
MARPLQTGLTYFPLDVMFDQDDKIALTESDFGLEGFSVIVKLLMKIYSEGYCYHWGEKEQKLFARKVGVDVSTVIAVVEAGLRWGLFSYALFDDYGILTSRGIQKRYFEAVSRRKDVHVIKEYVLLTEKEAAKYLNLNIVSLYPETPVERVGVTTPAGSTELMSTLTTQSKVKESRVEDSKSSESESQRLETDDDDFSTLLEAYKSKIESPTTQVEKQLKNWLTIFNKEVITEAITRTHMNGKSFSYLNAILTDFMRKGVKSIKDIETYDDSFKQRQQCFNKHTPRQESLPKWVSSDYEVNDEPVDEATDQSFRDNLERIRNKKQNNV